MIDIRRKLIMWLAGGMPVIANVHTKGRNIILYGGDNAMITNCTIECTGGTAIDIRHKGDKADLILSLPENLSGIAPR